MSSRVAAPSKEQVDAALASTAAVEKVQKKRPQWDDYVAEGIIPSVPQPDADGKVRVKVEGHDNVVKMLKMNEEANRLASWYGDNQAESPNRRRRREERQEKLARKTHRARASIMVPEMPWKRKRRKQAEG